MRSSGTALGPGGALAYDAGVVSLEAADAAPGLAYPIGPNVWGLLPITAGGMFYAVDADTIAELAVAASDGMYLAEVAGVPSWRYALGAAVVVDPASPYILAAGVRRVLTGASLTIQLPATSVNPGDLVNVVSTAVSPIIVTFSISGADTIDGGVANVAVVVPARGSCGAARRAAADWRSVQPVTQPSNPIVYIEDWTFAPATLALETGTLSFIAFAETFPPVRDYAGTIPSTTFCAGFVSSVYTDANKRGIVPTGLSELAVVVQSLTVAALRLSGTLTVRVGLMISTGVAANFTVLQMAAVGETEATNYLYQIAVNPVAAAIQYFAESGAGVNLSADWFLPGGFQNGEQYVISLTRSAGGVVRCYVNGLAIGRISATVVMVDAGNGSATGGTPTGGTSSLLSLDDSNAGWNIAFAQVLNVETSAATETTFVTTIAGAGWSTTWTLRLMIPDSVYTSLAASAGSVTTLSPDSTTVGLIRDWNSYVNPATDVSQVGVSIDAIGTHEWAYDTTILVAKANLLLTQATTIHAVVAYASVNTSIYSHLVPASEIEASNGLYQLAFTSTTSLTYTSESGAGVNSTAVWTLPTALRTGDAHLYSVTRSVAAAGLVNVRLYVDGTLLNVTSVTGPGAVNNTTFASLATPTGGTSGVLHIGNDTAADSAKYWKLLQILSVEQSSATVLATAQALGWA